MGNPDWSRKISRSSELGEGISLLFLNQMLFTPSISTKQKKENWGGEGEDFVVTGENSVRYNLINIQKLFWSIFMK